VGKGKIRAAGSSRHRQPRARPFIEELPRRQAISPSAQGRLTRTLLRTLPIAVPLDVPAAVTRQRPRSSCLPVCGPAERSTDRDGLHGGGGGCGGGGRGGGGGGRGGGGGCFPFPIAKTAIAFFPPRHLLGDIALTRGRALLSAARNPASFCQVDRLPDLFTRQPGLVLDAIAVLHPAVWSRATGKTRSSLVQVACHRRGLRFRHGLVDCGDSAGRCCRGRLGVTI